MKKTWLWWSSGKDSAWALHTLKRSAGYQVERLITTVTPKFNRVAIHGTRIEVLEAQAIALNLPVEKIQLPFPCSNADYEAAVQPVIEAALAGGVTHMAFGDLFLEDVRAYRENLLAGSGITPVFPIWGLDTTQLAQELVANGIRARITSLDPGKMSAALVGTHYDSEFLARLPAGVDPCGERGEFHTCVTDGPMFTTPIALTPGEIVERDGFMYADLLLS